MPIASAFRSVLCFVGIALTAFVSPLVRAQTTASDGFDPNVSGNIYAVVVQSDGKVLVAGAFDAARPNGGASKTLSNIARFLPDGTLDASFSAATDAQINAMIVDGSGRVIIGGKFTHVGAETRNRVARLAADGAVDKTFDPNVGGSVTPEVTSLAIQADGKLLVGGGFLTAGSAQVSRSRIARFNSDGTLDGTFDPKANGMVLSIAVQADQKILIGGGFSTLSPNGGAAVSRNRMARLNSDGTLDQGFDPNADDAVAAIAVQADGRIIIGGSFAKVTPNGGDAQTGHVRLARLLADGTLDSSFLGFADGPVGTIKIQPDGRVLVGGTFSGAGNGFRAYALRLLPDGTIDPEFAPGVNFVVNAFGVQSNGAVILGGGFTTLRGSGNTSIVRNHLARVSPNGFLDTEFRPDANGRLSAMALQSDGSILVAGSFTSVGGATHEGLVRLRSGKGDVDPSFSPSVNGSVLAILQQSDGKILIGGNFDRVNGVIRRFLARLNANGSLDGSFDSPTSDQVTALAQQADRKLLVGGAFTQLQPNATTEPVQRTRLARLNEDGSLDLSFNTGASALVYSIIVQSDKKILIGGAFTSLRVGVEAPVGRFGLARLNEDGSIDTNFDPNVNGTVRAMAVQSDGKIVFGGTFAQMAPKGSTATSTRNNIARITTEGALDANFDPNLNGTVATLSTVGTGVDIKVYVGGFFTKVQPAGTSSPVTRNYFVRLTSEGKTDDYDLGLDVLPGNAVLALLQPSSGKLLVGGAFTSVKPGATLVPRSRLVQISTADGGVDQTFNSDIGTASSAAIHVVSTQADGRVIVAGNFSNLAGSQGTNIARFYPDSAPDTSFAPAINGTVYAVAQQPSKGAPVATQHAGFAWLETNGQPRGSFAPASDLSIGSIRRIAMQDGNIIVAGVGSGATGDANKVVGSLARITAAGALDTSFSPSITGTVTSYVVQPDGRILIGGNFSKVGDVTRNNLARLTKDGALDTSFDPNPNGSVETISLQPDGYIVIGGNFNQITPAGQTSTARSGIARLAGDGAVDSGFNPNANGPVFASALLSDGKIVIGGQFTTLQPNGATTTTSRQYIARLKSDGTVDDAGDLKPNAPVFILTAQPDNKVIAGGQFSAIGGQTRNYIARINSDGGLDADFNPNPNNTVFSVSLQSDGRILISGAFTALEPGSTTYNGSTAIPRSYAARLNANGSIDPTFNPSFNAPVNVIFAGAGDSVLAAGTFTTIQPSGALLVGGAFTSVNGLPVSNLALFSSDASVSSTFVANPNGTVYAIAPLPSGSAIVGGSFTAIGGATRNHLARYSSDETLDASFNPNVNGDVYTVLVQSDGKIVVGGSFTAVGGVSRTNLARINVDGSVDSSFTGSAAGAVRSLALQSDGKILFTSETSASANTLGRLDTSGNVDTSFTPTSDGRIASIAVQTDGKIVVGGSFKTIAGSSTHNYLARLNANGSIDETFTSVPDAAVSALSLQADGKVLVGGAFSTVDSLPRFGLARIASKTSPVESFSASAGGTTLTWTRSGSSPEVYSVLFESSSDAITWTKLGEPTRVSGTSGWRLSGINLSASTNVFVRARGLAPISPNASAGVVTAQSQIYLAAGGVDPAPVTTVKPVISGATVVSGSVGSSFLYAIAASGSPTSYAATGLPSGVSINSSTGLITGTPTQSGTFTLAISATNAAGTTTSSVTLIVAAAAAPTANLGRLINLSVNAQVTASSPIIAGFVISGTESKNVLLRAIGPGLTSVGVTTPLAAPRLRLFNGSGQLLLERDGWDGSADMMATFTRLGAFSFAVGSGDAAMLVSLPPGAYSMHVTTTSATGGIAVAEVYDAAANPPAATASKLANISARSDVGGGRTVIGGFVITGTTSKRVLVRGLGPRLATAGVSNALDDPSVSLFVSGVTAAIATNGDWQTQSTVNAAYTVGTTEDVTTATSKVGASTLTSGSKDAAILVTLPPGVYSAQVTGQAGASAAGAAMVEIYDAD